VWWSGPIFYFANRNHSKFKFELNSNEFVNYKVFWILEKIFFALFDCGPKPIIHLEPAQSSLPLFFPCPSHPAPPHRTRSTRPRLRPTWPGLTRNRVRFRCKPTNFIPIRFSTKTLWDRFGCVLEKGYDLCRLRSYLGIPINSALCQANLTLNLATIAERAAASLNFLELIHRLGEGALPLPPPPEQLLKPERRRRCR
jgi:hypothetical protein